MTKEGKEIISKIVAKIRETYNLGFPVKVDELAKNLNINVVYVDYAESIASGKYCEEDGKFLIKISSRIKDEEKEKRFVIAHEIGHGILHGNLLNNVPADVSYCYSSSKNQDIELEMEADEFAFELLLPTEKLKEESKNKTSEELSDAYGVSEDIIEYRVGIIWGI